jgi:hypothetical protein
MRACKMEAPPLPRGEDVTDAKIVDAGKNKGIDTTYKTTLSDRQLNGCVVSVNGQAPGNMLETELHDGDNIEFVYGFCGG